MGGDTKVLNNKAGGAFTAEVADAPVALDEKSSDYERQAIKGGGTDELTSRLANPLKRFSQADVIERGRNFAIESGMPDKADLFAKGAVVAQNAQLCETLPLLDDQDRADLRREEQKRWDQPWTMYLLVICCSLGAVVQGECLPRRLASAGGAK